MNWKKLFWWKRNKNTDGSSSEQRSANGIDELECARTEAYREFERFNSLPPESREQMWEHFRTLPEQVRAYLIYEFARQDPSKGQSGFHFLHAGGVFWAYSWANTESGGGVSFAINHLCFAGRDPLLFYAYGDIPSGLPLSEAENAGGEDCCWFDDVYKTIEGYSSGVRMERRRGYVILFRLDEKNIRKLDIFYGGSQNSEDQPDYIFTWPGAGEFSCTLGEVVDGKLLPLHRDDFVMK